jgi:hypothetical protein
MSCPKCEQTPNTHSFFKFGQKDDVAYWYTSPVDAVETVDSLEKYEALKVHMEIVKADVQWIWVFNCTNMRAHHHTPLKFMQLLVKSLSAEHGDSLKEIWFVNPNMWIKTTIQLLRPFVHKKFLSKITFIPDMGVEFITKLNGVRYLSIPWKK